MHNEEKVRLNRLRRVADRRGVTITKSRRRDPQAPDFGRYYLHEVSERFLRNASATCESLDEVEQALLTDEEYASLMPLAGQDPGKTPPSIHDLINSALDEDAARRGEVPNPDQTIGELEDPFKYGLDDSLLEHCYTAFPIAADKYPTHINGPDGETVLTGACSPTELRYAIGLEDTALRYHEARRRQLQMVFDQRFPHPGLDP